MQNVHIFQNQLSSIKIKTNIKECAVTQPNQGFQFSTELYTHIWNF